MRKKRTLSPFLQLEGTTPTITIESHYLIRENRSRCQDILLRTTLQENEIIDVYIALHLILEIGLNGLYRELSLRSIKKAVDEFDIIENLDRINFIDKTIMFIYNSSFDFSNNLEKATEYHSVIKKIKDFSYVRNALLHGHSIISVNGLGDQRDSKLRKKLTSTDLNKQIRDFKFIIDGIGFYMDNLVPEVVQPTRMRYKEKYLDYGFLPENYIK